MNALRKAVNIFAPAAQKSEDGRDKWSSRPAFVLAAMGGAIGLGNILRYPSIVFNNNGLQWFIPYFIALFFLGIPVLLLEISIGQAYRGGCIVAYDHISKRAKGIGLAVIFNGYVVTTYYVPILCFVMKYFRNSFTSPLPWTGRTSEFYMDDVVANVDPVPGTFNSDGTVATYTDYPGTGIIPETAGWAAFIFFVVWLCMFKGVGLTGRVVYFTMGIPIVTIIILIGRAGALPNAIDGIKLYMGVWHSEKLGAPKIWQEALGQIFFSIGVGFGYFTSYASYNSEYSNAVQDALIIGCSNSLFEIFAAFAVFGVIGFLGRRPDPENPLSSFQVGFLTYPEAVVNMPGANFWSVLFFFTLMLLGISSSFALLESIVTMIMDSPKGRNMSRSIISTVIVIITFLISLMYCTEFGFYLLDAVDTWINYLALFFVVWCEVVSVTMIYRFKDVVNQVGLPAFLIFNGGYLAAQIFGLVIAHATNIPGAGAGFAFGIFFLCFAISVFISRTPDSIAPRFWGGNVFLTKMWWLWFYSGNQLTRDLNVHVALGNNWAIPVFWAPVLRFISAPILAIVFSFAYPAFHPNRGDPTHIFGFAIAHLVMFFVVGGLVVPKALDVFVPESHRDIRDIPTVPNVTIGTTNGQESLENGQYTPDGTQSVEK
ncbi:hypothetical protein ONS96_004807 [Cadophora gregata f. sp. sojae]|nr:hypothetical protein ONS96_004807 [Cadophora gregata f. sp. sojae]